MSYLWDAMRGLVETLLLHFEEIPQKLVQNDKNQI